MSFTNDDILILAKAGFNAAQIAALNTVGAQPTPQPIQQPIQQQSPQPIQQQSPRPIQQQSPQPIQQQSPQPIQQQITPPVTAPAPAPAPAPAAGSGASIDDVLKSVQDLTTTFQNGFLLNTEQPKILTAEDVLAEIINPPISDKK